MVELEGAVVKNCLVEFTYTDPINGKASDVYINPAYVSAIRGSALEKGKSIVSLNGTEYPAQVDGDPAYVRRLLEGA